MHVTLRAERRLPSLRSQRLASGLQRAIAQASHLRFRVVHYSVQSNHVHLVVEAHDRESLSRGLAGVSIRMARSLNRTLARRGRVWSDRYHARALRTPREVRHALVYVLMNFKKHLPGARGTDELSSAFWFDGWQVRSHVAKPPGWLDQDAPPVMRPRTWLAHKGWRRHGLIGLNEKPKPTAVVDNRAFAGSAARNCQRAT